MSRRPLGAWVDCRWCLWHYLPTRPSKEQPDYTHKTVLCRLTMTTAATCAPHLTLTGALRRLLHLPIGDHTEEVLHRGA
jgi:hypothetical protein